MPADSMPDFDSMTPEQIMAFMETLAKRQGATEGFTTAADMDIAEIDPSTVVVDEPGYVPYGEDTRKAPAPAAPPPPRAAAPAPPGPVPAAPIAPPPPVAKLEPVEDLGIFESETQVAPAAQSSMAWLESLAADQGVDLPGSRFSLSSLSTETSTPEPAAPTVDPMAWLESLAQSQDTPTLDFGALSAPTPPPQAPAPTGVSNPLTAGVDPVAWLESLAKRAGATEGFTSTEEIDIPEIDPSTVVLSEPGYTDYSPFAKPAAEPEPAHQTAHEPPRSMPSQEPLELEDPGSWLDDIASSQGFGGETVKAAQPTFDPSNPFPGMTREAIDIAAAQGKLSRDQMQAWLELQADSLGQQILRSEQLEEEMADFDPNAPAVPAELPDWLLEQLGQPGSSAPVNVVPAPAEKPPLINEILAPPPAPEVPDWLQPQFDQASADLDSIFQQTTEVAAPAAVPAPPVVEPVKEVPQVSAVELDIDTTDPWVQALDEEDALSTNEMPDWYLKNMNDPSRIAAVDRLVSGEQELPEAALPPEVELAAGEAESVPGWINTSEASALELEADLVAIQSDIPSWLLESVSQTPAAELATDWLADQQTSTDTGSWITQTDVDPSEIPAWLLETMKTNETAAVAPAEPVLQPVIEAPRQPAYIAPAALNINVEETLTRARAQATSNLTASLQDYESLIRGSHWLDEVVTDLSRLVSANKTNPAVYRVLGDGLMRQGKLQAALDTYRNALNQL